MNKKVLLAATNNDGKAKEIKQILGDFFQEIKSLKDLGLNIKRICFITYIWLTNRYTGK